jgi:hypothetical protein
MITIEESVWAFVQQRLGFSDDEMNVFRDNPMNAGLIERGMALQDKEIVFEFVEAHGCYSHMGGDRLVFDALGKLVVAECPERICSHAITAGAGHLFAITELLFQGIAPEKMRFKRLGCMDVGLCCGGWGHAVMELKVRDAEAAG